ncbi:MAG: 50S ribosomal protein L4 [Candidatus Marinimicrobia bacterium]|nr:50S ribosomal protein L4 [Candidatus Neomarinimicrobiota bacterium]
MRLQVHNTNGEATSKVTVHDSVFKIEPNEDVVYRAVIAEMINSRQGTHSTKTKGEVRGGGRKPWRQKGRGVARAGSIRSPIWRGGGVTFGPKPKKYKARLPKKMKRLARRSVLSQKVKDKAIVILDEIKFDTPKTKLFLEVISNLGIEKKKITFLPWQVDRNVMLSLRNIPNVSLVRAKQVSTIDLLDCDVLLFEKKGITELNEQLLVN